MEASTETAVSREIQIAASPETVWEFLVQPEKATRWMGQAAALEAAGVELEVAAQESDPAAWRADANRERISFVPGLLPFTMRYTNRPSGIQQVIEFKGHR